MYTYRLFMIFKAVSGDVDNVIGRITRTSTHVIITIIITMTRSIETEKRTEDKKKIYHLPRRSSLIEILSRGD